MRPELVDLKVILITETDKAVLVRLLDGDWKAWVPKSQCEIEIDISGKFWNLTLPERIAIEKELV